MLPTLTPLTEHLGYEVAGIDVSQPLEPSVQDLLRGAMATRGLLLFRDVRIDETQQVAFARVFGRLSRQGPVQSVSGDVTYVSNVRKDGTFGDGELKFHSDHSYYARPMKAIMLYGIEVPAHGGETLFSSAAVTVARMSRELRGQLEKRRVLNRLDYAEIAFGEDKRKEVEPVVAQAWHPALAVHAGSGQTIHMISRERSKRFDDLEGDRAEALFRQIEAIIGDPTLVYRHAWRERDLLVWDNALLQHARSPFEPTARRTLRRCAIGSDLEPAPAIGGADSHRAPGG